MTVNNHTLDSDDQPILTILQGLRDGTIDPRKIRIEVRQQCVEVCYFEGHTYNQIAQLFRCNPKTIQRDIAAIRAKNAISPNDDLANQLMGEIYLKITNLQDYLIRFTRNKEAKASEKIAAAAVACKALIDLAELLRSAGYIPSAPKEYLGKISHQVDFTGEVTWGKMKEDLEGLRAIAQKTNGLTPELDQKLKLLELNVEKSSIQESINQLKEINPIKPEDGTNE